MEEFLKDLGDFIVERLKKQHIGVEKTEEFRTKYNEYNMLYEQIIEFLGQTNGKKLDDFNSLLAIITELNDLYENTTYRTGFTDGINMIYSTYPQLKNDTKIE